MRDLQIPLEVCPTSNVCLGVAPSIERHPLPRLLDEGLYVTINSDDPPMFDTTLTEEYVAASEAFGWNEGALETLVLNAVRASFLPETNRKEMERDFAAEFALLRGGVN